MVPAYRLYFHKLKNGIDFEPSRALLKGRQISFDNNVKMIEIPVEIPLSDGGSACRVVVMP